MPNKQNNMQNRYLGKCDVRESEIDSKMLGLFATGSIPANKLITYYNGIWVLTENLENYVDSHNVLTISVPSKLVDGGRIVPDEKKGGKSLVTLVGTPITEPKSAGTFINDLSRKVVYNRSTKKYKITNSEKPNNCVFTYSTGKDKANGNLTPYEVHIKIGVYSTKKLVKNEEMGLEYGDDFWKVW